jgi:hypothetical protein
MKKDSKYKQLETANSCFVDNCLLLSDSHHGKQRAVLKISEILEGQVSKETHGDIMTVHECTSKPEETCNWCPARIVKLTTTFRLMKNVRRH